MSSFYQGSLVHDFTFTLLDRSATKKANKTLSDVSSFTDYGPSAEGEMAPAGRYVWLLTLKAVNGFV